MPTGPAHREVPYLSLLFRHHVELLFAHPGFSLSSIKVVLLGFVGLLKALVAFFSLLYQEAPQLLQVCKALLDRFGIKAAVCNDVLAPLKNVINARLVSLDFLLKGLMQGNSTLMLERGR